MAAGYERVRAVLPAHQAFQVKKWAEAAKARLDAKEEVFDASPITFISEDTLDKWGYPRVKVVLRPEHDEENGWQVGWFCLADKAVDELMVGRPTLPNWPWYRPAAIKSNEATVACALAGRAVKVILEQMKQYASDDECRTAIQKIQDDIEKQAMTWLQRPLDFGSSVL